MRIGPVRKFFPPLVSPKQNRPRRNAASLAVQPLEERRLLAVSPGSIVTGAGAGGGPHVRVFEFGSLAEEAGFMAGDFRGGVRVAGGDFNGDDVPDIATAPGPGSEPRVRIRSGADNALVANFLAYEAGFRGGVFVATGDMDGDNVPDIVTGPGAGRASEVKVFSGADGQLLRSFLAYGDFAGGVSVAAADVDGDGLDDIVTGAGPGGGPHVRVFSGLDGSELRSFMAYGSVSNGKFVPFKGGVYVAAGDVDGDGRADVITGAGAGGGPHVRVISGRTGGELHSFMAYPTSFRGGVFVAAGDADGDLNAEIITGAGPGNDALVRVRSGANRAILADFLAYQNHQGGVYVGWLADDGGSVVEPPDETPPVIAAALFNDTGGDAANGQTSDPQIGGSVSDQSELISLTAQLDGGSPIDVFVDASGNFLFDPALLLDGTADGEHVVVFTALDSAGNEAAFSSTFTLDTQVAVPHSLRLAAESDSGASDSDGVTNDLNPKFQGIAEPGVLVRVIVGAPVMGQNTSLEDGSWTVFTSLEPGDYLVAANAEDAAGNVSAFSAPILLVIDATPPDEPVFGLDPLSDTEPLDDSSTALAIVMLTGETSPNTQVELVETGEVVFSDENGLFAFADVSLSPGDNEFTVNATDVAGNVASYVATIVLEGELPDPPLAPEFGLDPAFDSAPLGDSSTDIQIVRLIGQTSPNTRVELLETGAVATSDENGQFAFDDVSLALGANELTVRAGEAANQSEFTATIFFEGDSPPSPLALSLTPETDTGASQTDAITSNQSPTVRGLAEAGTVVRVFIDGVQAGSASHSGGLWFLPIGPLADGTYVVTATAEAPGGQSSSLSAPLTVVIDTQAAAIASFSKRVANSVDTVLTHYDYDAEDAILEFVDGDAAGPNPPALALLYLHGDAADQVFAQTDANGEALWLLT